MALFPYLISTSSMKNSNLPRPAGLMNPRPERSWPSVPRLVSGNVYCFHLGSRHKTAEGRVLALGFGEDQEAAGSAIAFGPEADVLLVGEVGGLHHTTAGRVTP